MAFQNTPRFFSGFWTPLFCEYSKLLFKIQHTLSIKLAHNVLQLGEVADLEALTFNLALMFI